MTFSIVARDPSTHFFGVAIASKFIAVGAYCTHAVSGVGAASSQAKVNPLLGIDAIKGMAEGRSVEPLLAELTGADEGRDIRQVHIVDRTGDSAAWTGAECIDWAGHQTYDGYSVAGNMLAGPQVIARMAAAYEENSGSSFAQRLLAALDAGEAGGGDKRGKQSAAIYIAGEREYAEIDLRVDDHTDPLPELGRLYELTQTEHLLGFRAQMPRRG